MRPEVLFGIVFSYLTLVKSGFIYEEGEWETMIVDLISRALIPIGLQEFVDDPELLQKVDERRKISEYYKIKPGAAFGEEGSSPETLEIDTLVYARKAIDAGESIVVLRSVEDNLRLFGKKRTFVALRQNPLTNNTYFVSYVYLRFLTDKHEDCTETYLNEKICLEFDSWDNDRGVIKSRHKYFGWTDCASSFFQTCQNETKVRNTSNAPVAPAVPSSRKGPRPTLEKIQYKHSESVKYDDSIQAFWDLEVSPEEGAYIVETIRATSIFNDPSAFLARSTFKADGRALFGPKEKARAADKLAREKAALREKANAKRVGLNLKFQTLKSRREWLLQKNALKTRIRKLAVSSGLGQYFEIKQDPEKMIKLLQIEEAQDILSELEALGEEFDENELVKPVKDKNANLTEVLVVPDMDVEGSESAQRLAQSFGRELGRKMNVNSINTMNKISKGRSLDGRKDGAKPNNVAEMIAKSVLLSSTDTFDMPGWKLGTATVGSLSEIEAKIESEVFYGLGNCPYIRTDQTFRNLSFAIQPSPAAVADAYLALLRTYCSNGATNYLMHLIQEGYLTVDSIRFKFPMKHSLAKKLKLRKNELRKISAALEISSFSKNYEGETKHNYNWTQEAAIYPSAPSRSVHYLLEFGFLYLKQARKLLDDHFIKLCRNLVVTFKGVMTKLLQDREILSSVCGSPFNETCSTLQRINFNDRKQVHSFMEFLIRGLAPVEQDKNIYIDGLFENFKLINADVLQQSLEFYPN